MSRLKINFLHSIKFVEWSCIALRFVHPVCSTPATSYFGKKWLVLHLQCKLFFSFPIDKISPSNAFLLPQWGGIVIHNPQTLIQDELPSLDLDAIFSSFAGQLLGLLGVPSLPPDVECTTDLRPCITDWQLDALLRRRTLENALGSQETLLSIMNLVNQINNMPVGEDVRDDVASALSALTQVICQLFYHVLFFWTTSPDVWLIADFVTRHLCLFGRVVIGGLSCFLQPWHVGIALLPSRT